MQYKELGVANALGWQLAHSIKFGGKRLPKGLELTQAHIDRLQAAGIATVHAFLLDEGDITENDAARIIATHVLGEGLSLGHATRGRCNLHAARAGLLVSDSSIDALNACSEAITIATLPHLAPVAEGQLVATVKIIPYAVPSADIAKAHAVQSKLMLAPFHPFEASLITTGHDLPEKARQLTEARLAPLTGTITRYSSCPHRTQALADHLKEEAAGTTDLIMVLGLSAISDRRDIVPAALESAGGTVISLGMPVDPGNLLMLGELDGKTVLGLPGCARSPALNGLDWVLERLAARLPVDRATIAGMGIGGLLKETPHRPEPRAPLHTQKRPVVQPIILAAGQSTRAGKANKLLSFMKGKAVIRNTVAGWRETGTLPPIVVTGHEHTAIEEALSGLKVALHRNRNFAQGMATSLFCGLDATPDTAEFACIGLGDMPFVAPETLDTLVQTANRLSEFKIFIPTFNGKRGNPVLWHRDLFPELMAIEGDKGGRELIHRHDHLVCEVEVSDAGILIDLDTPEAMAQFGIMPES